MAEDDLDRGSVENPAARLISLSEAAELFGLSHSHLRKLAREGKLRAQQVGRYWVTTEEAVKEYLAQDRRPGPKPTEH